MRKNVKYFLLISWLVFNFIYSQAQHSRPFKLQDVKWRDSLYRFSQFTDGRITFIVGKSPLQKFNYNLFSGEIEFIRDNGDTLTITRSRELKLVMIGGHVFYHDIRSGYIEILVQLPLALGVKQGLYVVRKEAVVNDGYSTTTQNTTSAQSFRGASVYTEKNTEDFYQKQSDYFFIDQKNKMYPATRPAILRLFQQHQREIKEYCKENRIDFKKEKDLVKLIRFCNRFY